MTKISILHAKDHHSDVKMAWPRMTGYEAVADIYLPVDINLKDDTSIACACDVAVRLTSNTEGAWSIQDNPTANPDYSEYVHLKQPLKEHFGMPQPIRSTDVGDIIRFEDGQLILSTGFSFKRIQDNGSASNMAIDECRLDELTKTLLELCR